MTIVDHRPLVRASLRAIEQGRRLLPGKVLELEVERAIMAGRIVRRDGQAIVSGDGFEAVARREPRRSNPGLWQWTIVSVRARTGRR